MGFDLMEKLTGSNKTTSGANDSDMARATGYVDELSWRQRANSNATYKKLIDNILMGKGDQLDIGKQVYPQFADILRQGYSNANTTLASGGRAAQSHIAGMPTRDMSYMDDKAPPTGDLSFLTDYELPNYNTDRPDIGLFKSDQPKENALSPHELAQFARG